MGKYRGVMVRRKIKSEKLRVFGCIAFLHIPKELVAGKFESRSKRCYMIGYCKNGYKLWCPEDRKVISGKDVIFDESRFLFDGSTSEDWIKSNEEIEKDQDGSESNSTKQKNTDDINRRNLQTTSLTWKT